MKVAVIGLGYVGLPLALLLGEKNNVIAYDINKEKIRDLKNKIDVTGEVPKKLFYRAKNIIFTDDYNLLQKLDIYIIAVPTPIDKKNIPDLKLLKNAVYLVAKNIKNQSIVVVESTVYPGTMESICIPILKKISKLEYLDKEHDFKKKGFYCGFCPERVNPGDKFHTIDKITKVVSGSNQHAVNKIKKLYKTICRKIYIAKSIKVAEAAKIIENTQRDLNIALINELSKISKLLNIDTYDVLDAASTKWNFAKYNPGLVGGHCIGVDPYYLTYKAKKLGYKPNVILAGRKINDGMVSYVNKHVIEAYKNKKIKINNSNLLFLGCSFKENVTDVRNSKSIELIKKLNASNLNIDIFDSLSTIDNIDQIKVMKKISQLKQNKYDCIIFSILHDKNSNFFLKNYKKFLKLKKNIVIDLNNYLENSASDFKL